MGNSKTLAAARKHRHKKRVARQKVSDFLRSRSGDASKLSQLAQKMLRRRLRVSHT